jgi:microcystin-dependent protein
MFGLFKKPTPPTNTPTPPAPDASAPVTTVTLPEPYLGEIRQFAFDYAPAGWHPCDGSTLKILNNMALFALLGSKYGGDGLQTFALPTIPSTAAGIVSCIALQGLFPQRQ